MANNLFVSYDLSKPERNYQAVIEFIQTIGPWAHVNYSLWHVKTDQSAATIAQKIWAKMDSNDRLIVLDTTNNIAAWYNLDKRVEAHIQNFWHR